MAKSASSSELVVPVRTSLDLASLNELAETIRSNERVEIVDDPDQISREIFEQILGSKSDAELNQMGQATGWRELEGVPVKLGNDFRWRPSSYQEGAPVFLVVPAQKILPEGELEPVVLTTGSRNVIAQLMNMAARGTLEGRIVSLERAEKPSARGFHPLWLKVHNPTSGDEAAAG
jgi:hypothetical protein